MKRALIFIDNNWGADLTDMQLLNKFRDSYTSVVPLKDNKIKKTLQLLLIFKQF